MTLSKFVVSMENEGGTDKNCLPNFKMKETNRTLSMERSMWFLDYVDGWYPCSRSLRMPRKKKLFNVLKAQAWALIIIGEFCTVQKWTAMYCVHISIVWILHGHSRCLTWMYARCRCIVLLHAQNATRIHHSWGYENIYEWIWTFFANIYSRS